MSASPSHAESERKTNWFYNGLFGGVFSFILLGLMMASSFGQEMTFKAIMIRFCLYMAGSLLAAGIMKVLRLI